MPDARPAVGTPPPTPADDPALDWLLGGLPRNDMGNAERAIGRFGRDLIFCPEMGWLAWIGTHWSLERGTQLANLIVQRTAELINAELAARQDPTRYPADDTVWPAKEQGAHLAWAVATGDVRRLNGMLRVMEHRLTIAPRALDADAWILPVANGTLELRSTAASADGGIAFREHRRDDLTTRSAPVAYDREATCPKTMAWLQHMQPDPEIRLFMQRAAGYALTGTTGEQCAFLFLGEGANGKSTFVNLIRGVLGDYAGTLPVETLLEDERGRSGSQAAPELSRLTGVRVVFAAEPEKKRRLSTSAIKSMASGEPMLVRELNKPFFELDVQFKVIMSFNRRPQVPTEDEGMWRRLRLVPWPVIIPKDDRIPDLHLRLLREEAPGILNWMLDGLRVWKETGLAAPEAVLAATDSYRQDQDPIGEFLGDVTMAMPSASVTAADLYRAYQRWCTRNAQEPLHMRTFGRTLGDRGIVRGKSSIIIYRGITLRAEWQPPYDD
ncbi:putative DNA primase/helicase [Stella humosa]|uniref:Putative DNA primase/helicase n=2 Tax=Stella humosa TaxID=94 RepID=A0A3N1M3Z7_9PROT|nr:putative DNA primase/helicase [Stella humosa]BBK30293.1 phage protein [Stella humosa]